MSDPSAISAMIDHLRRIGNDTGTVEAKAARREAPRDLWKTLSAFSNSEGGTILLGIDESTGFATTGVERPQSVIDGVRTLCQKMEPKVRPVITEIDVDGRRVVAVEVPALLSGEKPCYYTPSGIVTGSHRRVGDADVRLSDYEVGLLLAGRSQPTFDVEPVQEASLADLNAESERAYLAAATPAPFRGSDVDELRRRMRVTAGADTPTLAALLSFGVYPQEFHPGLDITVAVHPTPSVGASTQRLADSRSLVGPVPTLASEAIRATAAHLARRTVIEGVARRDIWEVPIEALREIIVNALVHRDLSPLGRSTPVRVDVFPDRVEVVNPGGLYGGVTVATLGSRGIAPARNAVLVRMLQDVRGPDGVVVEHRATGIARVRTVMAEAGLPPPEFEDGIGYFRATLRRRIDVTVSPPTVRVTTRVPSPTLAGPRVDILERLRSGPATRRDLEQVTGLSRAAVQNWLRTLLAEGVVVRVGSARSPRVTYGLAESELP